MFACPRFLIFVCATLAGCGSLTPGANVRALEDRTEDRTKDRSRNRTRNQNKNRTQNQTQNQPKIRPKTASNTCDLCPFSGIHRNCAYFAGSMV